MPTVILASRFNTLRDSVDKILGVSNTSTPTFGYGTTFTQTDVVGSRTDLATADTIDAQQYKDLYIDILRARIHQVGAASVTVDPFVVGDYDTNTTSTDKVEEAYVTALESLATNLETDKFLIDDATQADVVSLQTPGGVDIVSFRDVSARGTWNGTITHIFDVEFDSAAARRHFFNSGGQIRLTAEVDYAGTQNKTVAWQSGMSAMGAVSIAASSSFSNNSVGSATSTGNYQLGPSYQLVYRYQIGGLYARNYYNLYALSLSDSVIRVKVEFNDGLPNDTTWGIDEQVFGDWYSTAQLLVPNGSANINGVPVDTVVYTDPITGTQVSVL
jgi:hypothetical protein